MTEYFVPRFPLDLPVARNPNILNITLARIDSRDLSRVMTHWEKLNGMLQILDDGYSLERVNVQQTRETSVKAIKRHFRDSVSTICQYPVAKEVFEKYLLRSHVTIHSGAKAGNKYAEKIARAAAYVAGRLAKKYGFDFWYGGGSQGLMGESGRGFASPDLPVYPDQYSVQVTPAPFVVGIKNAVNGMAAVNEGLAENTDAAIVMPHFIGRRHILDTVLTEADAAMTLPGAYGSVDEWSDIATHIKTGLMPDRKLIGINLQMPRVLTIATGFGALTIAIPFMHEGYWDPLEKQRRNFVKYGYGRQEEIDAMPFKRTPEEAFSYLMKKLDSEGRNPHQVYEQRLAAYRARRPENSAELVHTDLSPQQG